MVKRILGVDLGGTRMRAAVLNSDYCLLNRLEDRTRAYEGPDVVISRLLDLIAAVMPGENEPPITAIGVSSPGPIEPHKGVILSPPNLPGWVQVPLGHVIQERFGLPTFLGNDANVAALAEVTNGAARGHQDAVYITVSTGIGGGIVIGGRLFVGGGGLAGEIGHMIIMNEWGEITTLEREAAGPALARYAVRRIKAGTESRIVEMVDGDLDAISGRTVGMAAQDGDALALETVQRAGRLVGYAITTLMHLLNPTIFVIGGGVSMLGDLLFEPIRETARAHVLDPAYAEGTEIVPAALGDDVAIIGAAALAFQQMNGS